MPRRTHEGERERERERDRERFIHAATSPSAALDCCRFALAGPRFSPIKSSAPASTGDKSIHPSAVRALRQRGRIFYRNLCPRECE